MWYNVAFCDASSNIPLCVAIWQQNHCNGLAHATRLHILVIFSTVSLLSYRFCQTPYNMFCFGCLPTCSCCVLFVRAHRSLALFIRACFHQYTCAVIALHFTCTFRHFGGLSPTSVLALCSFVRMWC